MNPAAVAAMAVRARPKLAVYKLPRRVLLINHSEISYTGNDKIRLEPLRARAIERFGAWEAP